MESLIKDKVYYKIFDRSFRESSQFYSYDNEIDRLQVNNNREIVKKYLKANFLYTLKQVHGSNVVVINNIEDLKENIEQEGDAVITDLKGLSIAVKTADCVPVLLASDCGNVIAAIHCSSKSTKDDIISKTIKKMHDIKNIDSISAIIGPSIQKLSYEVRRDFYEEFLEESNSNDIFFTRINDEKYLFDLPDYVITKLKKYNVKIVHHINEDTYSNPSKYPSHRYSFKRGEKYQGCILSVIVKSL